MPLSNRNSLLFVMLFIVILNLKIAIYFSGYFKILVN